MITGSIVLALVAAVFLVLGVWHGPELFYYGSIAASVLASLALVYGLRHQAATPAGTGGGSADIPTPRAGRRTRPKSGPAPAGTPWTDRADHGPDLAGTGRAPVDVGLPDEPPEQPLTPAAAARLLRVGTEVVVIDGRPRFHIVGCLHLLGRETQRLPVLEAMEGGFTPCSICRPAGTSTEAERSI